ncbi:MAG: ATP-binding cassette domain-containing protein [Actinomycetota bacterium]
MVSNRGSDVVRIDEATVAIASNRVLGPVSLTVRSGETWAILGPNGSGKSTLLDLAGGIRHPTSGVVEIFGGRLGSVDVRAIRARIGFVGHHVSEAIPAHLHVRDVVLTGKRSTLVPWMQTFDDDDRRLADELLHRVRCEDLSSRSLETCSQGERQRVLLARALFGRPELLLLDEPMAGLDLPGRESLLEALSSTADASPTMILVTHHVEEIPRTATHAALLRQGRLVSSGPIRGVLTDANVTACFDLALSVSADEGRWRARAR